MKKNFYSFLGLFLLLSTMFFSCDSAEIADIEIRYEVTATSAQRKYDVTYTNNTNGSNDEMDLSTGKWTKTIMVPSNAEKKYYSLLVDCYSSSNVSQSITAKIFVDNKEVAAKSSAGTSGIYLTVSKELPESVKYK